MNIYSRRKLKFIFQFIPEWVQLLSPWVQLRISSISGAGITDLVFDENQQERKSWRFCNSRVTIRSCLFYLNNHYRLSYCRMSYQLGFFKFDCEGSTFWFSLLSCTVGSALAYSKLWIKLFQRATDSSLQCLVHLLTKLNWISKCYYITLFHLIFNHFLNFISTSNQSFDP